MIIATLSNGTEALIAGASVDEVMEALTAESLTGSAVPLADAELTTTSGGKIRYADVVRLENVAG